MRVEEREKVSAVKVYISDDGMEFADERSCKRHEESFERDKALKASDQIPHYMFDADDICWFHDEFARLYYIRDKNDLDILNNLFDTSEESNDFHLDESCIGTFQIITEAEYDDYQNSCLLGSFDEWKNRMLDFLNTISASVMEKAIVSQHSQLNGGVDVCSKNMS